MNPLWVVTAAHCVSKQHKDGKSVTLTFGDQVIQNVNETGEVEKIGNDSNIHKVIYGHGQNPNFGVRHGQLKNLGQGFELGKTSYRSYHNRSMNSVRKHLP